LKRDFFVAWRPMAAGGGEKKRTEIYAVVIKMVDSGAAYFGGNGVHPWNATITGGIPPAWSGTCP
jgi:hypothetical protein